MPCSAAAAHAEYMDMQSSRLSLSHQVTRGAVLIGTDDPVTYFPKI